MAGYSLILFVAFIAIQASRALNWESDNSLPNGTAIPACHGQDVTLHWSYALVAAEHVIDVEWFYRSRGGDRVLIATQVSGSFISTPNISHHVEYVPNAGIRLRDVTVADSGTYSVHVRVNLHGDVITEKQTVEVLVSDGSVVTSDAKFQAKVIPKVMLDNSTGDYHVQLSCGPFNTTSPSQPSVVWKTPSNQTLPSSSYGNGFFLLSLSNPVETGMYTCAIEDTSPVLQCSQSGLPSMSQKEATVMVDGTLAQLLILEARTEAKLEAMMANQRAKESELEARITSMEQKQQQEIAALQTQFQQDMASMEEKQQQNLNTMKQYNLYLQQQFERTVTNLTSNAKRGRQVSFHAIPLTQKNSNDNPILFDDVKTNIGGGYNASTGKFTAPVSGVYFFVLTVNSAETDTYVEVFLMADGGYMGYTMAEYRASGTMEAVVHLRARQQAWTGLNHGTLQFGKYCTFTGFLIYPD